MPYKDPEKRLAYKRTEAYRRREHRVRTRWMIRRGIPLTPKYRVPFCEWQRQKAVRLRAKQRKAAPPMAKCMMCGGDFVRGPRGGMRRKFCSEACRLERERDRDRARSKTRQKNLTEAQLANKRATDRLRRLRMKTALQVLEDLGLM